MEKNKVILVIRDGYGRRDEEYFNAVIKGNTPFTDNLMEKYPTTLLRTSGEDVGLPNGYMGGSEVGHLTIGSGRIIWQSLELINRSIRDGSFFQKEAFLKNIAYAKESGKAIHMMGLLQDKGVHSHQDHLFALLKLCKEQGMAKDKVIIHVFSDGRDSPERSVGEYVQKLEMVIKELDIGIIGSLIGRYYAMDRDTRWDRTKLAYDALVFGKGEVVSSISEAIDISYSKGENDEFITPKIIGDFKGIFKDDVIFFYNYRTDRVRQLCYAFFDSSFSEFETKDISPKMSVMTTYYEGIPAEIAFLIEKPVNILGEVLSKHNAKQLRISETEKYPHVTFFFNGQIEEPFPEEKRILIPSPRDVATYDEKPEMSIFEIKDTLISSLDEDFDVIVVNYVNGDMVGHTGIMQAAVKAVEAVDKALEELVVAGLSKGYDFLIFADHGNCEEMEGEHKTSHTLNDVDCILVSNKKELQKDAITLSYGGLKDVSPTVLDLLSIPKPFEMTGVSLIKKK